MKEMLRMADKSKVDEVKQMLEYTQKGTAKATVGNYMVVLRNDPLVRESMKYNKLTGRIDIVKKLWWNEEICKLDDDGRTYFYYFFERYYKLTSEKCMDKALRIEANSRAYHPICEYLEQLEWDGQERIRYVLQRYMGADASDFVYEVVKHFLMEALSRIYRPGCKADEMLCLVGQQGAGKSTFFRFLALNDDWFSDDLKQLNDSKIYEHLRGHWIMEMSEMIAAISAKSNEEIKSFLTRQKDTYRNPYDKYEEDRKRQCIFAGSTNTRQFIPFDRTGARRFLPIAIDSSKAEKHILDDEKEARAYFDQLWAEAMEIYWSTENKSSLLKFSKEMEQKISEYRKQFTQEDTMAGMIQGWLDAYKGKKEKDNIVLMINIDSILAGDNLYLYGGRINDKGVVKDVEAVNKAFEIAKKANLPMQLTPKGNVDYPYPTGQKRSDHAPFSDIGIPYIYFEANNWLNGLPVETENHGLIMHSDKDDLSFIENEYGNRAKDTMANYSHLLHLVLQENNWE